ncbi:glycosyl hydrolase [Chitinophagaceae bacterium LB-8]|uniref:Glycosyl hydrolase n=1 Tax=Paraflavisolibacter caeni TaxID=2982496 RepID=A0A9X2XZ35_9BACT|nr:glycoside hydrolase family 30 protein [Paraflavisolibacter caeni]MCU7551502.1 glycosyl hydrolase [Paraflavisolibacter caeni]
MKHFLFTLMMGLTTNIMLAQTNEQNTQAESSFQLHNKKATVYMTANNTNFHLSVTETLQFTDFVQPKETDISIFVDPTHRFQTFIGMGGALTDASAETFAKLPKDKQQELLKAYYDPNAGIGYTLARTNMNSCDFSSGSYTYVKDNDKELKTFSIMHDQQYKIPFIKQAIAAAGGTLKLFISPWSPPAWMKDNNNMLRGGKLKPEYYQSWANYYVKFIRAYEKSGIPVWGLTVQNEPMATQTWESCLYTGEEERDFIKKYLGPTLQKEGLSKKKLIAWDHNRDLMYQRASTVLNDPDASQYVWGIGYHWYETWTGAGMQFDNVKRVAEAFPGKNLIFTEGCIEKFNIEKTNDWALGEKYGRSVINDLNSGASGWTDWNVLLDETGGPNHVGNFCFAPVHANTKTGELIYTNAYHYLGHFSKFIRPGAKRIISSSSRDVLQTTAFINESEQLVVVVLNLSNDKIPYYLWIKGKAAKTESLPHSIATIVI